MHSHYINKLLNIEDVIIKKIQHVDTFVKIYLGTNSHEQVCPCCDNTTKRIHNYRYQTIKDLPFQLKHCYLVLHKRRYVCKCGKRFYETYPFHLKYFQRTARLTTFIASSLHSSQNVKETARQSNVSTATVGRVLDTISYSQKKFPTTISIDEFRGNASTSKFQCILVNPIKHKVDILPDRQHNHLVSYFSSIPKDERHRVKHFVCDMWKPYIELAHSYFPNAEVIIDKYHFIRQTTWAIEGVRKRLQKIIPARLKNTTNEVEH